jgi:uncharacterized RDD family membrane protein YckC
MNLRMTENHAYIVRGDDGVEYGPVDLAELREWVAENRAGLGTEVRLDAPDEIWHPWHFYPELVALLAEVRVTGMPPPPPPPATVLAPLGRRFLAGIVDLILVHILVMPLVLVSFFLLPVDVVSHLILQSMVQGYPQIQAPPWFEALINAIYFGGLVIYYAGFQALHGQTPAKALLHLRVVDEVGRKPTLVKALLRALVLVISLVPLWSIPLFATLFHPQRRGLHDLAAGTYVVEL